MSIFNKITKTFQWGDKTVIMETGEIARQAGGAVLVNIDDTVVLATVVASNDGVLAGRPRTRHDLMQGDSHVH